MKNMGLSPFFHYFPDEILNVYHQIILKIVMSHFRYLFFKQQFVRDFVGENSLAKISLTGRLGLK